MTPNELWEVGYRSVTNTTVYLLVEAVCHATAKAKAIAHLPEHTTILSTSRKGRKRNEQK